MLDLTPVLLRWLGDPAGSYRTWFAWEKRQRNAGSIRCGVEEVIREIDRGIFGAAYSRSSMEAVVRSIAEQRQLFRGADEPFRWNPRRRTPDIYADRVNRRALGRFLDDGRSLGGEDLEDAIRVFDARGIRGLGPAVANLVYFLRPDLVPPVNATIAKGYNLVAGTDVELSWNDYLACGRVWSRSIENTVSFCRQTWGPSPPCCSTSARAAISCRPPRTSEPPPRRAWQQAGSPRARRRRNLTPPDTVTAPTRRSRDGCAISGTHSATTVWIASSDRGRAHGNGKLGDGCLEELPETIASAHGAEAVRSIDVLWLRTFHVTAAFEVEHSSSIHTGLLRLLELAIEAPVSSTRGLFFVAPRGRASQVRTLLQQPFFARARQLDVRFLSFVDLEVNRSALGGSGGDVSAVVALARSMG